MSTIVSPASAALPVLPGSLVASGGGVIFQPASSTSPLPTAGTPIKSAAALTNNTTATAGVSFFITVSVTGTVTLTLSDASTIIINPQVGDTMLPFGVTKYVTGTATVTRAYNLS